MSQYSTHIHKAIDYIEDNIYTAMTASDIARFLYLSEYHFSRLFAFMVGMSPIKYMLRRKLTHSLGALKEGSLTVGDVALKYGYAYPEVYARAFKKYFGVTPGAYKKGHYHLKGQSIAEVITRDVIHLKGNVTLRSDYVYLDAMDCYGYETVVDLTASEAFLHMQTLSDNFLADLDKEKDPNEAHYYNMVRCLGNGKDFNVFVCTPLVLTNGSQQVIKRHYKGSWYIKFYYKGDMGQIEPSLEKDILNFLKQKKEPLEMVEPGLFIDFGNRLEKTNEIGIMVKIRRLETEDEAHIN